MRSGLLEGLLEAPTPAPTSSFSLVVWIFLALSTGQNVQADSPPPPPPPTVDQTVQGASVVVVATGVAILYLTDSSGAVIVSDEPTPGATHAHVGGFVLRAKVGEILHCDTPCPSKAEVFIALGLDGSQRSRAKELFLGKEQLFLLVDRPFDAAGLPERLRDTWYATNRSSIGFFLPVERRSEVEQAIRQAKPGAVGSRPRSP